MTSWLERRRRRRLRARLPDNPLARFLDTAPPAASTRFADAGFLCLDLETTGLDAATADLLSVGWVAIADGGVELATAESYLARGAVAVGDSATVHGLTDTVVATGDDVSEVLGRLLGALAGRVLVVHHAGLDKALLDRLCDRYFGAPLLTPLIDTLELERRRRRRHHHLDGGGSFSLAALRSRSS
ncbi:MAG: 3'-5' exonuclease, partial [Pseudomonadota bacterium]